MPTWAFFVFFGNTGNKKRAESIVENIPALPVEKVIDMAI